MKRDELEHVEIVSVDQLLARLGEVDQETAMRIRMRLRDLV